MLCCHLIIKVIRSKLRNLNHEDAATSDWNAGLSDHSVTSELGDAAIVPYCSATTVGSCIFSAQNLMQV